MKLRIKGNSLRLRISRTEMARLLAGGGIEETICFGKADDARLTYALEHRAGGDEVGVEYRGQRVSIVISTAAAMRWAQGDDVGIYGSSETACGPLEVIVEKDFACLDGNDPHDADAFPNPTAGAVC
jgi:hypothetical protein